jgi:hypothetical protein
VILTAPPCTPVFVHRDHADIRLRTLADGLDSLAESNRPTFWAGRQRRQEKPMTYYVIQGLLYIGLGVVLLLHAIERL